jgi:hypothetical protein
MHTSLRLTMIIAVQCTTLMSVPYPVSAIHAQSKESSGVAAKAVETKVTGARLSYVPVDISPRRRNARSEANLLKKASARISTSKILTYRRRELPRRTYRLTLERKDAKSWFVLFWPEDTTVKNKTGDKPRGAADKSGGEKAGNKSRRERRAAMRLPLSLATVRSEDHRMVFALKSVDKGKRIRIVVRAGSTQLSTALRLKTD